MFDLASAERLSYWKKLREQIETSQEPFQEVVDLWSKAPFVNPYLDPFVPDSWPDPWHLILDGKFDDLAICLGMLYTLKLTQRFYNTLCEIHMSMPEEKNKRQFYLLVHDHAVLNFEYGTVSPIDVIKTIKTNTLWSVTTL